MKREGKEEKDNQMEEIRNKIVEMWKRKTRKRVNERKKGRK